MPSRRNHEPKPLYRRVNTRTHGVRHGQGGEARWERNTKAAREDDRTGGTMRSGLRHGLDYTPLFRFLLSKIGEYWHPVHAEAVARLDSEDPIWWMVSRPGDTPREMVRTSQNAYWSGLFIDADERLAVVAPELSVEMLEPSCACCTHTFNGVPFTRRWRPR